jgi:hypothetical protein
MATSGPAFSKPSGLAVSLLFFQEGLHRPGNNICAFSLTYIMKIKHLPLLFMPCLIWHSARSQVNPDVDPVAGTWKGSSLCQVKDSPCHDEIAVYHAKKLSSDTYQFQMNKMVNGKEEEMGPLTFSWNDKLKTLTGVNKSSRGTGTWRFQLVGNKMHGTLTIDNKTLFRIIDLKKD